MKHEYVASIEKESIEQYPLYLYDGEVVIISQPEEVACAAAEIAQCRIVGFDTETRPSFKKGVCNKVSLLQLATRDKVFLFRLHECGLTDELKNVLADKSIIKVGVGVRDDIRALRRLNSFVPGSFLDLQTFAPDFGIEDKSFSKLMAIIFSVRISKRQRVTNWEAPQLTEAQVRYAATDAWGARCMFIALYRSKEEQYLAQKA